jgi:hypothetical protein
MTQKSGRLEMALFLLTAAAVMLTSCGDSGSGDPSGPPANEELGAIWILNRSEHTITTVGVNYASGGYYAISLSDKDPFGPEKIRTTGKNIEAGECTLVILDSSGYFYESPEFTVKADDNLDFLYDGKTIKKVVFTDSDGNRLH